MHSSPTGWLGIVVSVGFIYGIEAVFRLSSFSL
jgi:hypothetical protein